MRLNIPARAGFFGAKREAKELREYINSLPDEGRLQAEYDALAVKLRVEHDAMISKFDEQRHQASADLTEMAGKVEAIRAELVEVEEIHLLQEIGVYEYRHPMESVADYKAKLDRIRADVRAEAKNAITGNTDWTVNGSKREGTRMVKAVGKLLLKAYNNDVEQAIAKMRPHKLDPFLERLHKSKETIERLGAPLGFGISSRYHRLRLREVELTCDWEEKKAEEREAKREHDRQLREEAKAEREMKAARAKLNAKLKEAKARYESAKASAAPDELAAIEANIKEIEDEGTDIEFRLSHVRSGYVYVISNLGSFGEDVVKIGMTRRLDPMDRVRELSGASVPYKFDLHAMVFSEDAVELENRLHKHFNGQRLNLVNRRKEFFRATPTQVKQALGQMNLLSVITEFDERALAEDWRTSEAQRRLEHRDAA